MSVFSKYQCINAEGIVKANVRPDHVGEDVTSLLNALQPITYIVSAETQRADKLHRNVIQKLRPKKHTLDLLELLGYELNTSGDYAYRHTTSSDEIDFRQDVAEECQRFSNDLKKIKAGNMPGFKEFLTRSSSRPQLHQELDDEYEVPEQPRSRLASRASFRQSSPPPPPPLLPPPVRPPPLISSPRSSSSPSMARPPSPTRMPDHHTVQMHNQATLESIRTFKDMTKARHAGPVAHSFIRRRLLLYLFKQKYPTAVEFGDDEADVEIDRQLNNLKHDHRISNIHCPEEVYYECLLRCDFDQDQACKMLRDNRPNLQPPPEPEQNRGPTMTTLENGLRSVGEQWDELMENADEDGGEQVLVHAGDEWKNTAHVVATVIRLRQSYDSTQNDNRTVDKMFRVIFSELSQIIGPQSVLKIEILANALCEAPEESIKELSMVDIRDIVLSCDDTRIPDNFEQNTSKALALDCPVCAMPFPRSRMEEMFLCRHICCVNCIKEYYRNAIATIQDSGSLKKLTCFTEEIEITDEVKMNFFNFLGTKLNQWFTNERRVLDLYHENLYIATRNSSDKKCGNPQCAGFFYNDNKQIRSAQCPHCRFEQCQQCCRRWYPAHAEITCDQYADWLYENDPNDPQVQLVNYLNTAGMVCPNETCGAVFEYQAGGCEHFTCPKCKTEFCRICSVLFYNPAHNTFCPQPNCGQRNTLHAHCRLNCFREIRDATNEEIIQLLTANHVNVAEELRQKPQATGPECPVPGCTRPALVTYENRFCETCYKQFLCLFVWRRQIEPWALYGDNNLAQKLRTAGVNIPANIQRPALIALAQQHLTQFLGKPKKIDRRSLE